MKKRYVIYFEGLFERGYVQTTRSFKNTMETVKLESGQKPLDFATKFRFKWRAQFVCWICNFISHQNGLLKTYTVKEVMI